MTESSQHPHHHHHHQQQQQQQQPHPHDVSLPLLFDDHGSCSESGTSGSVSGGDLGRYSDHIEAACVAASAKRARAGLAPLPDHDEKVRKRRISNLLSVRQSRSRKKERVQLFQMEANRLSHANAKLKVENEQLEGVLKQVEWVIRQRPQIPQLSLVCNAATMNPFQSTKTTTTSASTITLPASSNSTRNNYSEINVTPTHALSSSHDPKANKTSNYRPMSVSAATAGWGPTTTTATNFKDTRMTAATLGDSLPTASFADNNDFIVQQQQMQLQGSSKKAIAQIQQNSLPMEEFRHRDNIVRERSGSGSSSLYHHPQQQQPQQQQQQPGDTMASFRSGGAALSMIPPFQTNSDRQGTLASNMHYQQQQQHQQHNNNTSATEVSCQGMIHHPNSSLAQQQQQQHMAPMNTFSMMMDLDPLNAIPEQSAMSAALSHNSLSSLHLKSSFFVQYQQQQQQQQQQQLRQQLLAQPQQQQVAESFGTAEQNITPFSQDGVKPRSCLHPAFYFGSSTLNTVKLRQPMQESDVKTASISQAPSKPATTAISQSTGAASTAAAAAALPPSNLAGSLLGGEGEGPRNCLHPSFYFGAMAPGAVKLCQESGEQVNSLRNMTAATVVAANTKIPHEISFPDSLASLKSSSSSLAATTTAVAATPCFFDTLAPRLKEPSRCTNTMALEETDEISSAVVDCNCEEGSCYSSFDEEVNMVTL